MGWTTGNKWTQFRFSVGAPDAQTKFNNAVREGQKNNENMVKYPSIYVRSFRFYYTSRHRTGLMVLWAGVPRVSGEELAFGEYWLLIDVDMGADGGFVDHSEWVVVQGHYAWAGVWERCGDFCSYN